jgi:hypothetical protein
VKGGSAAPHRKGKATYAPAAHDQPKKWVSKTKNEPQKPKESIWAVPNKYAYQPKPQADKTKLDLLFCVEE